MLHSHLTTLNAVSLILNTFKAEGLSSEALLAGSGISAADLNRADTRITTNQEMQVCANAVALKRDIGLEWAGGCTCPATAFSVMHCSPVPPSVTLCVWRCVIRRCWEHFSN
jgi:hypothetical protein